MFTALGLILALLIFTVIAKKGRRFIYDGFSFEADDAEFERQIKQLSLTFRLPDRRGKGIEIGELKRQIKRARRIIANKAGNNESLYEYEHWLYDNYSLYIKRIKAVEAVGFDKLPHSNGAPRVLSLARTIVSFGNAKVTRERVLRSIDIVNEVAPLTIAEINALNSALSLALLEKIGAIAKKCYFCHIVFRAAIKGKNIVKKYLSSNVYRYYAAKANPKLAEKLDAFVNKNNVSYDNIDYTFSVLLVENNILTASTTQSLQQLNDVLADIFEKSSVVSILLKNNKFAMMDLATQRAYVNEIALQSDKINLSEEEYATSLLRLEDNLKIHFGAILFDHKKVAMRYAKTGVILSILPQKSAAEKTYVAGVILFCLIGGVLCGMFSKILWLGIALSILTFCASIIPAVAITNRLADWFAIKRPIMRMAFNEIPDEGKTLVTVPVYISNEEDLRKNIKHIKELQSVNDFNNCEFVLLLDYKSSKTEVDEQDAVLNQILSQSFSEDDRVGAIVRKRQLCGDKYAGFERKRGAVEQFVEYLVTSNPKNIAFSTKTLDKPQFMIILDADNTLAPQGVLRAVNAVLHPYNEKYDIMAFTGRTNLYSIKSIYSKRFMSESGAESYPEYGNLYQNLCGRSVFCGKGIIRLESFFTKLHKRLPEGKVLSHDIIEGALLETGLCGETTYEDAPQNFATDILRKTRWKRGDIQLLSLLNLTKASAENSKIPLIYRFLIIFNAFSVLYEPIVYILAICALFFNIPSLMLFTAGFLAVETVIGIFGSLFGLLEKRRFIYVLKDIGLCLCNLVRRIFTLPYYAVLGVSLFFGTLYKMTISKKGLLNWKPYCSGENAKSGEYAKMFFPSLLLSALVTLLSFLTPYFLYCVAYFAGLLITYTLLPTAGVDATTEKKVTDSEKEYLKTVAEKTYHYFEKYSVNGLIADNYQLAPKGERADYTSPTNIGFSVLAHISAMALEIIDKDTAQNRIMETIDSIEKLQKWNGHLYNWYNIETKKPLSPCFVSSVDSGNLTAALLVASEVFGGKVEKAVSKYLEDLNFSALFDGKKQQFYIGYNKDANRFEGHYDNLVSEARLLNYVGIAYKIPEISWDSLSRDYMSAYGNTLMSWSGTVFEYLMSELFLDTPQTSLLGKSCKNAVKEFIAEKCGGVWGISESGYFTFDNNRNYQYKAFGIDSLSLKSEPSSCVVSPYSSFLSLKYNHNAVLKNLKELEKRDALNELGFFEALDQMVNSRLVLEYMAHHQGMIMASIANFLCDDFIKSAFYFNKKIAGARLLLTEKTSELRYEPKIKNKFRKKLETGEEYCSCITPDGLNRAYAVLKTSEYGIVLDDCGNGYSICDKIYLNRFRADKNYCYGEYFYVQDGDKILSPSKAPMYKDGDYKTVFTKTQADFLNGNVAQTVYAPSFFDGELRRLSVENDTDAEKTYKVAFYTEMSLNTFDSDASHRAFSNIFVQTEFRDGNVYATRNCLEKNKNFYSAMRVFGADKIRYTTNRFNFVGRATGLYNPPQFDVATKADDFGTVLEPCFAFVAELKIPPKTIKNIDVYISLANSLEKIEKEMARASSPHFAEFTKKVPYIVSMDDSRRLDEKHSRLVSNLLGRLLFEPYEQQKLYNICAQHAKFVTYSENFCKKVLLFKYDYGYKKRLVQAARVCKFLNGIGVNVSLVVSYTENDSYYEPIKKEITDAVSGMVGKEFFFVTETEMPYEILKAMAFYDFADKMPNPASFSPIKRYVDTKPVFAERNSILKSGEGYFSEVGYEVVPLNKRTLLPYSNIICGEFGGTIVTDNGGYTYFQNSREWKITEWSNDAVIDNPSERLNITVFDDVFRLNGGAGVATTHSLGMTEMFFSNELLSAQTSQYIIENGKIKIYEIVVFPKQDLDDVELSLSLDLALGAIRKSWYNYYRFEESSVKAVNIENGKEVYLKVFGGELIGDGIDFGAKYKFSAAKNVKKTFYFAFGGDKEAIETFEAFDIGEKKNESLAYFSGLNPFSVETGNICLDLFFNNWLMYQVVSCRINGRTSFYQAGGAIGFRDQLQDCLALIYSDATKARKLILSIAEHTYIEGDVMHWWHGEKHGVRTRISDDKVFLPYVVSEYVSATGDLSILDEKLRYLTSKQLTPHEKARYEDPKYAATEETLKLHLERIMDCAYALGENGLILIRGGDWNDALDEVGSKSSGESVWLSMFYYDVLGRMEGYYEGYERMVWITRKGRLKKAIENCFTGKQYKRLVTKDGEWLGADLDAPCEIDIISQAWASLCGACNKKNVETALKTAKKRLFDQKNGLIMLLTPPFDTSKYYGYISCYPKGIRENGGQYTHGAIWFLMALINEGKIDEAFELFNSINPLRKGTDLDTVKKYKGEPYVLAADVYTGQNAGRAGWTWYTGSASWCYKLILEGFFGIRLKGGNLELKPRLPNSLQQAVIKYRFKTSEYIIKIVRADKKGFFENDVEIKNGNLIKPVDGENRSFEFRI